MERKLEIRQPVPQNHQGLSTVSKIFFGVDIFQVIMVVAFQGIMIVIGNFNAYNSPENPGMGPGRRIYMCVFMGVVVYTCFLCLFAVKQQNFLEILAFLLQNFGFVTYGLIQVYHVGYKKHSMRASNVTMQHNSLLRNVALSNSLTLFLLNGVFIFLSWKLYIEFGWQIYKRVRFNISLRSIYHFYQLLSCLLKMAIMYWWMYAICNSLVILRDSEVVTYYVNLAFIPMSVLYACLGYIAIQREIRVLMVVFIAWTVGVIGYFVYKLYGFMSDTCTGCQKLNETGKDIHDEAILHFVYLGSLNLLLLLAILGVACKVFANFGKGLEQHFKPKQDPKPLAATDLYLRRVSHYVDESAVSVTSYGSDNDDIGYRHALSPSTAPLLQPDEHALASSMPSLLDVTQKARSLPVDMKSMSSDLFLPLNNNIVSPVQCKLAVIDEDFDLRMRKGSFGNGLDLKSTDSKDIKIESTGLKIRNGEKNCNGLNGKHHLQKLPKVKKDKCGVFGNGTTVADENVTEDGSERDGIVERDSRDSGFVDCQKPLDPPSHSGNRTNTRKTPVTPLTEEDPFQTNFSKPVDCSSVGKEHNQFIERSSTGSPGASRPRTNDNNVKSKVSIFSGESGEQAS